MPPKKKTKQDSNVIVLNGSSDDETDENLLPTSASRSLSASSSNGNVKKELDKQSLARNILNQMESSSNSTVSSLHNSAGVQVNSQTNDRPSKFLCILLVIKPIPIPIQP